MASSMRSASARATKTCHWDGLDFTRAQFDAGDRRSMPPPGDRSCKLHSELFEQLAARMPEQLLSTKAQFERQARGLIGIRAPSDAAA